MTKQETLQQILQAANVSIQQYIKPDSSKPRINKDELIQTLAQSLYMIDETLINTHIIDLLVKESIQ